MKSALVAIRYEPIGGLAQFDRLDSLRHEPHVFGTNRSEFVEPGIDFAAILRRIDDEFDLIAKFAEQAAHDVRISPFVFMLDGRKVDLRISTFPGNRGEKTVIRVLDTRSVSLNLRDLGFAEDVLEPLQAGIRAPNGIILVTGPTGSGKSTTLYAALNEIASMENNICTVEDPIEYHLSLINQFQVQERVGLTFSKALRTLLRQDPDVIMK